MNGDDAGTTTATRLRPWTALRITPTLDPQIISAALFEAGSQGVQEDGGSLVTHFPPGYDVASVVAVVKALDAAARIDVTEAPSVDWSAWRASVGAHRLGKVSLVPPWLANDGDPMQVIIDPAMAFGTGEHATTRGVIRLMQVLPRVPQMVADIGAGSAVLAICAARLGAMKVFAIEIDHDAIGNAELNVDVNGVADRVFVFEGDAGALLPLVAPVELILANIISSVLIELLPTIRDSLAPNGNAILSGILVEEKTRMLDELGVGGWTVLSEDEEAGWWSVLIERPQ